MNIYDVTKGMLSTSFLLLLIGCQDDLSQWCSSEDGTDSQFICYMANETPGSYRDRRFSLFLSKESPGDMGRMLQSIFIQMQEEDRYFNIGGLDSEAGNILAESAKGIEQMNIDLSGLHVHVYLPIGQQYIANDFAEALQSIGAIVNYTDTSDFEEWLAKGQRF